ncbi:MAG TPA: MBL fold metallo-hydrolase [Solirubrobacteraceae bacterium]|jgi:glyoxylase-like metal-dependent hydrolase (beta-lactamase superfamily II)
MKTTQISDDLIQLTRLGFVNAYLVREDDGLTLIDTTVGRRSAPDLLGAARAAGGEIRRIALTHGHGDHAGGLDAIKQKLGDAVEVSVGEPDARVWAGEKEIDGKKATGYWTEVKTKPDVLLRGGERIGSLEVVPSPGHTLGHVAFLDTRDGSLIAGDVFTAYGRVQVTNHFYWRFPLAYGATVDREQDLASARALRGLDSTRLLVGHGPATANPGPAMDAAIARSAKAVGG